MTPATDLAATLAWLGQYRRPLLVTHERPDGDAIGALTGAWYLLRDLGAQPTAYVAAPVHESYTPFTPPDLVVGGPLDPAAFDAVVCLDCARLTRNALPAGWRAEAITLPMANIDHHVDNPRYGQQVLIDAGSAATCELLTNLLRLHGRPLPAAAHDALLMGLVFDTGGYRFTNTTAHSFACSAWLLEQGARLGVVMHQLFMDVPFQRLRLQAEVIQQVKFACDGRLAWFAISQEMLDRHGLDGADAEELVDVVRGVRGTDLVCRLQQVAEGTRLSLRARDPRWPALAVATRLGGGGHQMAAGALLKGASLAEAEAVLVRCAEDLFHV